MAAGSIVIDLLLRTGSFSTDTQRAAKDLAKFRKEAYDSGRAIGDSIRNIAAAAGVTLSVAAFTSLIKGSIDAADHLNDLSKKTGIAVDTLGGIGFAAEQSGSSLDAASAAMGKLNKTLAEAASGNQQAKEAFDVLGISVKDAAGNTKSADAIFAEVADKFAGYADGPEKAALAIRIFGKAGAEIIPLLDEGGRKLQENVAYYKQYSGVTQEVAEKADVFNDTLTKLNLLQGSFGRDIAASLLPSLQAVADEFLHMKENGEGFKGIADDIKTVFDGLVEVAANVAFVFVSVGREIGAIAAQLGALAHFDFQGFSAIGDAVKEDGKRARAELDRFIADYRSRVSSLPSLTTGDFARADRANAGAKKPAPRLSDAGATSSAQAELKKQLEAQLRLISQFGKDQQQRLDFANKALDSVYADGLISLQKFFDEQQQLRDEALANELKAIDAEIAARKAYAGSKLLKPEERIDAESRLAEAVHKRGEAVVKAGRDAALAERANARELEQVKDRYDDLRATILDLQGDIAGASKLRIDQQVRDAERLISAAGGDPNDAQRYRTQLEARVALSKAQDDYNLLLSRSATLEDQFLLRSEANGASLMETEQGVYALRSAALVQLGELRDRIQALADASDDPRVKQQALEIGLAYERAARQVDPALNRLRDGVSALADSISSDVGESINNFTSLRDVVNSVQKDLLRFGTKLFVTDPLEKSLKGALQGLTEGSNPVGDFFKNALGIGGGAGSSLMPGEHDLAKIAASFGGTTKPADDGSNASIVKIFADSAKDAAQATASAAQEVFRNSEIIAENAAQASATAALASAEATAAATIATASNSAAVAITLLGEAASAAAAKMGAGSAASLVSTAGVNVGSLSGLFGGSGSYAGSVSYGTTDFLANPFAAVALAEGTNFVPYDNFPAMLHKGEAVVPAKFNNTSQQQRAPRPVTINQYFPPGTDKTVVNQAALKTARAVQSASRRNG